MDTVAISKSVFKIVQKIVGGFRDGNGSGHARIVPTRNSTRQKKIRPLPVRLLVGYPLKKYPRIFLKPVGTRGYPIPANI